MPPFDPTEQTEPSITLAVDEPVALTERYELRGPLGKGPHGRVYLAYDRESGRFVAVKVLRARLSTQLGDSASTRRLLRAAVHAASVEHPGVARVLDAIEVSAPGPTGAWVIELLEGTPLRDLLGEVRLPADRALAIARDVVDAVAAAHMTGVIHGGLHAGNVLVDPAQAYRVWVTDLAVSRVYLAEGWLPETDDAWLAPEVRLTGRCTTQSDVFALGVLLRALVPADPWADAISQRATRPDPSERFPDAMAMRAALVAGPGSGALDETLSGPHPRPVTPSVWERLARFFGR
jgi:serine/threonine-protein kinase